MSVGAHIKVEDSRWWFGLANVYKKKAQLPVPTIRETCPEYQAGFFSRLTFQWMALFMRVGYRRPLELNDIWDVNPSRSVPSLQEKLLASFERRKANGEKRLLTKALYDTFRTEFLLAGFCSLVVSLLQVLTPFSLRYLIQFASDAYMSSRGEPAAPPISHGVAWAIGITCMQIIQSLCFNHFLYLGMIVGGQSRAVLIALIFDKASQMSGRARAGAPSCSRPPPGLEAGSEKEMKWFQKRLDERNIAESSGGWSNGRITNLMSMDTSRIHHAAVMIHFLWTSPVCVLLALALLLVNISYSALPGIALLLLVLPLLAKGVQTMVSRRKAINTITDERVSLTQEMLNAMRFIKYFSWESIFLSRLADVRKREISRMRSVLAIRHVITAISTTMSTFATLLAFTIFALSHHELKSSLVFSSLSLFGALSMPLNQFPLWLGYVTDAMHSIERIEEFLLAEEAEDPVDWDFDNENAVVLKHASFVWEQRIRVVKDSNLYKSDVSNPSMKLSPPNDNGPSNSSCETQPFKLEDLNLKIGRNELVAVIGPVASGKSSLLAALAGDMIKTDGMITLGASRAFCSQSAWIQNATVRENIRFGEDSVSSSRQSNERRYKDILDACALRPDLETFPSGDRTELGEKGITISGGQKQRLNIARAIYSNADLILMDDPLSSVDAHVGQHIMDHAICGLMSQKSRILVTHQLNILHRCDRVVVLSEGKIVADGTFEHLLANNSEFQQMMATVAQEERQGMHGEYERHASGEERVGEGAPNERDALMQDEERAISSVRWSVYAAYVRASGTILNLPLILLLLTIAQGSHVVTGLWLSWWTSDNFDLSLSVYIGVFAVLGSFQAFSAFVFYLHLSNCGTAASRALLHSAVVRVLRAPMKFFDTTPLGRIINRFSRDVDTLDNNLSDTLRNFLLFSGQIVAVFVLTIACFPFFAIALGALTLLFAVSVRYYLASAREVKRFEAVLRSHVFTRFTESIDGIPTIRAYGLVEQFSNLLKRTIDEMDGAYFLTFANQSWLSIRLDAIGNLMVLIIGILVVTSRLSVDPSISGFVLSYFMSVVQYLQYSVRQYAEVQNSMNSVERLHFYGNEIEQEAATETANLRSTWPEEGKIVFQDVEMRYRKDLPLVLHGFSAQIKAGERIGVVGRTGAGKSSLISTLFRMTELSGGFITIDGLDISKIGLKTLRSRLTIIPQEPTLFRGTIRSNLDPFDSHSDLELWSALRQAGLTGEGQNSIGTKGERVKLDARVDEGGGNFSLGQRQLLALARALVRSSQIIVCDEATSSVDFDTDRRVQQAMIEGFKGKTLLCIAHRLKTVIGYDRICVLDAGKAVEFDTPLTLWKKGGIFRGMCDNSGIARTEFNKDDGYL